jgi:hypothetical protein
MFDYEIFAVRAAGSSRRSIGLWITLCGSGGPRAWLGRTRTAPLRRRPTPKRRLPGSSAGGEGDSIALPPLNETDPIVRELVKKISMNPRLAAWLATNDLIRSFTIGVANVAQGQSAARQLPMFRPPSNFRVIERGNQVTIDPKSYARYDTLAAAVESLDPAGSARVYATLPRIEEAARELGDSSFDRTFERAIVSLLSTPTVNDPILVETRGIGYGFVDPKLEELTAAQKHLIGQGLATPARFRNRCEPLRWLSGSRRKGCRAIANPLSLIVNR